LICIAIPVNVVFFLAMCFWGACRASGTTQIMAWAVTLSVAYLLMISFLFLIAHLGGSTGSRFREFWTTKERYVTQKVAESRAKISATAAATAAARARREVLRDSEKFSIQLEVNSRGNQDTRSLEVCGAMNAMDLKLAMDAANSVDVTFKMGGTEIISTLESHDVQPDAYIICTCNNNAIEGSANDSAFEVPDYDTPDGPYSEFQPEFAEMYDRTYISTFKEVFIHCYKEVTDMDRTESAVDRVELKFETAAADESSLDDLHASSGCWRCFRFNPVDEAIVANLVVYLVIVWASYVTYASGEIGTTGNSTTA